MSNEIKEEVIILLNECVNKITKAIIKYNQNNKDDVYLQTIRDLLNDEIKELVKKGN